MDKKQIITAVAGFVVGALVVGGCFAIKGGDRDDWKRGEMSNMQPGMHRMSNGQMMNDNTNMMQKGSMQGMMMDMTVGMQGKSGKDLEKAFLQEMVPHHQGAIDMAKMLLASTSTPENLRNFAQQIIDAQSKEITQMNEWLKAY